MSAADHAFDFLLPVDPNRGIRVLARKIWAIAESDPHIAAQFVAIQEKLGSGKSLIDTTVYDRVKDSGIILDLPAAPEPFRPVFVAAYLRAKAMIASGNAHGIVGNLEKTLTKIQAFLEKDGIEKTFATELLTETALAARESPAFARTLHQGAAEFRVLVDDLYGPDRENRPTFTAQAKSTGGGGGGKGDCICCSTAGGNTTCGACSCWLIVIVIIIIIVAK